MHIQNQRYVEGVSTSHTIIETEKYVYTMALCRFSIQNRLRKSKHMEKVIYTYTT